MKRTVCLMLAAILLGLSLSACTNDVFMKKYGTSELYSKHEMNAAVDAIMRSFRNWDDDCRMIEVEYAGDEVSLENLDYCNSLSQGETYDACIVFVTAFRTSSRTAALNPNDYYTGYKWFLARSGWGAWKVVACGYG